MEHLERIKSLMQENAIGIEEFANCLGISVKMAQDISTGHKALSKSLAKQIEQTFSKPQNWFFDEASSQGKDYDLFG